MRVRPHEPLARVSSMSRRLASLVSAADPPARRSSVEVASLSLSVIILRANARSEAVRPLPEARRRSMSATSTMTLTMLAVWTCSDLLWVT